MAVDYRSKNSKEYGQDRSQPPGRANPGISFIHQTTNAELRQVQRQVSPLHIMAIMIGGIVLAEVIAMIFVYYYRFLPYYLQVVIDASIMAIIIYPVLYFLSFKPLISQLQQRQQSDNITQARLRLMQFADTHTMDELLQAILDEIEILTGSTIGFFHFLEADQKILWLQAWSSNTLQNMCKADGKGKHYDVEQAGVWADCVRQRQPVIHNDYAALPHRKGLPEGHANIIREMAIPIMRAEKIVAILGLGNKPQVYTARDVEIVTILSDFAWDIVERKRAENALHQSEEKFRTLVDWTYDWEKWVDPRGTIVYASPACERITGYTPEEFIVDSHLLMSIVHPDDRKFYEEHQNIVHDEIANPARIEYRIISRDGNERWIEHVCRPLYGKDNGYLGRRVSDRDITERKRIEAGIHKQYQKEKILTETLHTIQTDIARDLHDTLGQNISFLRMNLEHLSEAKLSEQSNLQNQIQTMTKVANESYELIRTMLAILQSGNSVDPLNLFTRYAEQVSERSPFKVEIISRGNPKQLSAHQMRQLFYIFREALNNIEKYANPNRVIGEFGWDENALTLVIEDNGSGFDLNQNQLRDHYGIKFMKERASRINGSLTIQSAPGMGTKIAAHMPYEEKSPTRHR